MRVLYIRDSKLINLDLVTHIEYNAPQKAVIVNYGSGSKDTFTYGTPVLALAAFNDLKQKLGIFVEML